MGKTDEMTVSQPASKDLSESKMELAAEDGDERETWGNQCEFFLSCLGYAVGFGNVWRFPYLCYQNGGAVFLIPYVIMLFCAGLPLFFMELALGQYVSLGPNIVFKKIAPIFSGLGWSMLVISSFVAIYYNMILAWTLFYTFASMTDVLPWSHCNNDFNSVGCFTNDCASNDTVFYNRTCLDVDTFCELNGFVARNESTCEEVINSTSSKYHKFEDVGGRISASEDYFKNRMLGVTGTTWDNMGSLRWELVGCLALAWTIVCLCLIKGVKSSGKVVYFTAIFPYVVLFILFIRGITLEGAYGGIEFYIMKPNVTKLTEIKVWNDAATQIFYSLGSSFGGLITLASYNKFSNNCMRDAIVIALANCATSVFAGFVIFSILGFMAHELGKDVGDVVASGSGLAFIAYPEAVTRMPLSPLWAILFFVMLITLGLDSQFTMVETLTTAIFDQFESLRGKKPIVVVGMCFCLFLCGITMCLEGGSYMFDLFDNYSAGLSVVIVATTEIVLIQYVYGFKKYISHITDGIKIYIPKFLLAYWVATWVVITPLLLVVILVMSLYYWKPIKSGDYELPPQAQGLGWLITISSLTLIPIFAAVVFYRNRRDGEPWENLFKASEDFCPAHERRLLKQKQKQKMANDEGGSYKFTRDNAAFDDEGVVRQYPRVPQQQQQYENTAFEEEGGEARAYSNGGNAYPDVSDDQNTRY